MADFIQDISDWLIEEGLGNGDFNHIVSGFCERLSAAGVPIQRGMISVRTLHPEIDAHSFIWTRGGEIVVADFGMDQSPSEQFLNSPLNYLLSRAELSEIRRRLSGPQAEVDFEALEEFRDRGGTDYFIQKVPFGVAEIPDLPTGMLCSWTSDAPDGFNDADLAVFRRLAPRLALAVRNILQREITLNVLDVYVGRDAGRRILTGEIHRGSLREIDAVILFMDLRGFTALADRFDGTAMADLLNVYFEAMVSPVVAHGGEILKFMGDGILATFSLLDFEKADVCRTGLDTAAEILRNVDVLNVGRVDRKEPAMGLDIALHLGHVMYGNVGAANRLDFTVIGSAVNEANRLEALCDDLDCHLAVSETFAASAVHCADRLVSLGRHTLRGVAEDQEVYTLREFV